MDDHYHQLRITLRGSKPPIWRRVAVPSAVTLGQLHEIIQIVMDWDDDHLHAYRLYDPSKKLSRDQIAEAIQAEHYDLAFGPGARGERHFVPGHTPFGDPVGMEGEDEYEVLLGEVLPKAKHKSKLLYEYDFGDSWEHQIEAQRIEPMAPDVDYPVCLAGKRASPPEDIGGVLRYEYQLQALVDPKHKWHDEAVEWLGDGFDPEAFDIEGINAELDKWREWQEKEARRR